MNMLKQMRPLVTPPEDFTSSADISFMPSHCVIKSTLPVIFKIFHLDSICYLWELWHLHLFKYKFEVLTLLTPYDVK